MARIVQKFGGTSVASVGCIRKAAEIAVKAAKEGHEVATVVSAMGQTTDELISLAEEITSSPNARELDMLLSTGEQQTIALMSMAIQELGWQARSFTGGQAGIYTENQYGKAKIREIQPQGIESSFNRGEIPVVAGFQGVTQANEVTTLGRGGSDTTAVALASVLGAERCDIYTDVSGVFTADPRLFSQAKKLPCLSYEEMLELAATGAQVINHHSVGLAMDSQMPVRIRSTFQPDDLGTLITNRITAPEYPICGITLDVNQAWFNIRMFSVDEREKQQRLDSISSLFTRLNELNISSDMVMLLAHEDEPFQDLAFTVEKANAKRVQSILKGIRNLGDPQFVVDEHLARVSIIGRRLTHRPEIVASVFEALTQREIPIQMVATGDLRMSLLVPVPHAEKAVTLIHNYFGLEEEPQSFVSVL